MFYFNLGLNIIMYMLRIQKKIWHANRLGHMNIFIYKHVHLEILISKYVYVIFNSKNLLQFLFGASLSTFANISIDTLEPPKL